MRPIDLIKHREENKDKIKDTAYAKLPYIGELVEVDMTNGDHIMIYGRPKSGKTTLVINYMMHLANLGNAVTVFNTETVMSGYKYATRILALLMKQIAVNQNVFGFAINSKIIDKFILYGDDLIYGNEKMNNTYWDIYNTAIEKLSGLDIEIYDATSGIIDSEVLYAHMRNVGDNTIVCLDQINQIVDRKTTDRVSAVSNVLTNVSQIIKEKRLAMFLISQISTGSSSSVTGELPFGGYSLVAEINAACKPTRKKDMLTAEFTHVREAPPFTMLYNIDEESGLILNGKVSGIDESD